MFFPQFDLHIEIDEPFHNKQKELDINREADIVQATNHRIERIKITDNINFINEQIDKIIEEIKVLRNDQINNKTYEPWDLEEEFKGNFKAPFVKNSPVQMSMKFIEEVYVASNDVNDAPLIAGRAPVNLLAVMSTILLSVTVPSAMFVTVNSLPR
jgi:superfamily I DNA and/or RNA helicase